MTGPLAPYAEEFRENLLGQGYTWGSAAHQIHLMAHVSCWLQANGLGPADLDEAAAARFAAARCADGYARMRSARALVPLLGYLRGLGVAAAPRLPQPQAPADRLAARFGEYLARERGLAARLAEYPAVLGAATRELAPHTVAFSLRQRAGEFHSY